MGAFKRKIDRGFWFALAVLFLIESWLWDNVKLALVFLARALGLERLEARLRDFVARLSPAATLAIFAVPALSILPLKVVAVAMIAKGHIAAGLVVIFAAKSLALGATAFLFDVSRDTLLAMQWFAKLYALVLRIRAWAEALIAPVRERLHSLRELLRARLVSFIGKSRSGFLHKLSRVRALARRER